MPRKLSKSQAQSIAKGKLAGKPKRQIAAEVGVSESTVSHPPPEVKGIMRRAVAANQARLEALLGKQLDALEADLSNDKLSSSERRALREEATRQMILADRVTGELGAEVALPGVAGAEPVPGAPAVQEIPLAELLGAYQQIRKQGGTSDGEQR